jgi:hypothetical protein
MSMWDNADWIRMGDGMRALKIATIVMGVLIVAGTMALVIGVARRAGVAPVAGSPGGSVAGAPAGGATWPASVAVLLDEPAGTHIAGIVAVRDRLAVQLQGGGVDRVVLIDAATGTVAGRISLVR